MRRDKMVARILLIFSVVNATLAGPAVVRQGLPDAAGAASENRHNSRNQAGEPLHLLLGVVG